MKQSPVRPRGDLTAALRRQAGRALGVQEELRAVNAHLRAVTDAMGEGLVTLDARGRVTYMNHTAEALLGWRADELTGQVAHDVVNHTRPDGRPYPAAECPLAQFIADPHPVEGAVLRDEADEFIRKDGSRFPVAYSAGRVIERGRTTACVLVFRDITAQRAHEAELSAQAENADRANVIREALAEGRMELHAQPIVELCSGAVVKHELLIRMRGRDGELVSPCEFLPDAEAHGLIGEIDRWVIGQAAALVAEGHSVEINLSGQSIGDPATADYIAAALSAAGGRPELLAVEITETALVTRVDVASEMIRALGTLGCPVALDDFGTGHAGFSYIKRLPFHAIKIDLDFVRELPDDEPSRHVVRAVVDMARNFGYRTVAEGVETPEALEALRELGVDHAQGWHLGRPGALSETLLAA